MNLRHSEIVEIYSVLKYGRYHDYSKREDLIDKFEDYLIGFAIRTKDPVLRLKGGSYASISESKVNG